MRPGQKQRPRPRADASDQAKKHSPCHAGQPCRLCAVGLTAAASATVPVVPGCGDSHNRGCAEAAGWLFFGCRPGVCPRPGDPRAAGQAELTLSPDQPHTAHARRHGCGAGRRTRQRGTVATPCTGESPPLPVCGGRPRGGAGKISVGIGSLPTCCAARLRLHPLCPLLPRQWP